MTAAEVDLNRLVIFQTGGDRWPNPNQPRKLDPDTEAILTARLEANTAAMQDGLSVESLCTSALLRWHLGGDENVATAEDLWRHARSRADYTQTKENDAGRELACQLMELDLHTQAWRTIRLMAATLRGESRERQGYTAFIAADMALGREQTRHLARMFAGNAKKLWAAAIAAGGEVDAKLMEANDVIYLRRPQKEKVTVRTRSEQAAITRTPSIGPQIGDAISLAPGYL